MLSRSHRAVAMIATVLTLIVFGAACGGGNEPPRSKKPKKSTSKTTSSKKAPTNGLGPTNGKVDLANPGTVVGKVLFKGAAPERGKLDLSRDEWCSSRHEVLDETFVVDGAGGLADVVAHLKGLDAHGSSFELPGEPVRVVQKGCQYIPHVLCVRVGQEVAIVNADETSHNYHFVGRENDEINRTQPKPTTDIEVFEQAETGAKMTCDIHSWMACHVHIFEHPCFAVSGKDGSFEITGVPPGRYALELLHADGKSAKSSIPVTVAAGGRVDIGEVEFTR